MVPRPRPRRRAPVVHGQARLRGDVFRRARPLGQARARAMQIALAEGEPEDGGVATVDVDDVKAEADRLREDDIEVGTSSSCTRRCGCWTCTTRTGTACSSCRSSAADQARKPAGRPVPEGHAPPRFLLAVGRHGRGRIALALRVGMGRVAATRRSSRSRTAFRSAPPGHGSSHATSPASASSTSDTGGRDRGRPERRGEALAQSCSTRSSSSRRSRAGAV